MTDFISPVGRFVQGSISLEPKVDPQTNQPKLNPTTGQPIMEMFFAVAFRKDDPEFMRLMYQPMVQTAMAAYPSLFNAQGQCTHPKFAMKLQDGDGVDTNGQSVAGKPGFAGHWIVKMGTQYLPKCFHHGKYDPSQQIQNPSDVIKRGYYVRVNGTIRDNGVSVTDRNKVPGLFVSPNLIELVAFGEEIVGGPDAAKVFGGAPAIGALPPGASATPLVSAPGAAGPLPGVGGGPLAPAALPSQVAALPAVGVPAGSAPMPLPGVAPAPMPLPGAPVQPQYVMTASANGYTREQLLAQNWTDEALISQGLMVRQ